MREDDGEGNFSVHNPSSGINYESGIKDLSAFSRYKRIEYALEQKFKIFDALSGDLGWKEKWKLVKTPQYIFEK
jgi:hypothetical protein